jgi:hypothetical protein
MLKRVAQGVLAGVIGYLGNHGQAVAGLAVGEQERDLCHIVVKRN